MKNQSTKKKVRERQAELLRTLRASGQDTLALQFAAAFKDPKNLHGSSQQAINSYLDSRLTVARHRLGWNRLEYVKLTDQCIGLL